MTLFLCMQGTRDMQIFPRGHPQLGGRQPSPSNELRQPIKSLAVEHAAKRAQLASVFKVFSIPAHYSLRSQSTTSFLGRSECHPSPIPSTMERKSGG